jgi:DNA-binding response OmpR family regulator
MKQYNYEHLAQALRRAQFVPTRTSEHNIRWERLEVDGTSHRVILRTQKLAKVPYSVLRRLLSHAGMTENDLLESLGWK